MKRKIIIIAGLIAALGLVAIAAGAAAGAVAIAAGAQGAAPGQQVPQADLPKPLVIPAGEKARTNPVPDVPEAVAAGKTTYASQCTMCHGASGNGRGDLALSMKWSVPDFTRPGVLAKRTDGELFYIMTTGHGEMPGEKRLPDQSKWEIVRFLRTLAPEAAKNKK